MKYVITFNIAPGKADQFWRFMEKKAAPFWSSFSEVSSLKVYTVIGGSHLYEAHLEMSGLEAFDRLQKNPKWSSISKEFLSLVEDVERHFLTEGRDYLEVRGAA